jgi:hypothetical protein
VVDGNGIEVTRYGYESDAKFYARRANADLETAQERAERIAASDRALVSDLEADGLL